MPEAKQVHGRDCYRRVRAVLWVAAWVAHGVLGVSVAAAGTGDDIAWAFSATLTGKQLAELAGRDGTRLDQWIDTDLHYDARLDGIVGSLSIGSDLWLRDADALDDLARVHKWESPFLKLASLEVEVLPAGGGKTRRIREGDLVWTGMSQTGAGVVTLDAQSYTAVLPGLHVGDRLHIVERYRRHGAHGMPVVDLRNNHDAWIRAAVRVKVPAAQGLSFQLTGPDSLTRAVTTEIRDDGGTTVGFWELRDVRRADGTSSDAIVDAVTLVTHVCQAGGTRAPEAFVGAATWAAAAAGYRQRIEPQFVVTPALRDLAREIVAGHEETPDRIAALYRHVQATTRYLGLFREQGGIIPAPADETRRLGYGDCKGLSTYLIGLCRAVDIDAWPVLVLTGYGGRLAAQVPNLAQFDHFIAWADDGRGGCWLDPTLEKIPAGTLVPADAASAVLVMRPGAEGLAEIPRSAWSPGCRSFEVVGALDATLRLRTTITLGAEGPGGRVLAARLTAMKTADRAERLRALLLSPALRLDQVDDADQPAVTDSPCWRLTVQARQPLVAAGGRAFLSAELAALDELHARPTTGSRQLDLRDRPDRLENWTLAVPAGWRLAAPDSFVVECPGVSWRRTVRQEGGTMHLCREIRWTAGVVDGERTTALQQALADAVARERAPIVLQEESR
jgi:hypothetical protein